MTKNLLIITQKVDQKDSVLGFFHLWIEEFARRFSKITVICLEKGEVDLPENVKVFSLGKEKFLIHNSRFIILTKLKYIWNFYKFVFKFRHEYDSVFIHMNQEYALLGGIVWRLLNKKTILWRNHPNGNWITNIAVSLMDKVCCTSKESYTAKFKKTKLMPVGIDTGFYTPDENVQKIPNSILFLGRISTIKHPDVFVEACGILKSKGVNFKATIVGDCPNEYQEYFEYLKNRAKELFLDNLDFLNGVPSKETLDWYRRYEIYVNATDSGSFDKTILEAMACGSLVVVSNHALKGEIDNQFIFEQNNASNLAQKLESVLLYSDDKKKEEGQKLMNYCQSKHSLALLVSSLKNLYEKSI